MSQLTSEYLSLKKPGWTIIFSTCCSVLNPGQVEKNIFIIRLKHEKVGAFHHGVFCLGDLICLCVFCPGPFCASASAPL